MRLRRRCWWVVLLGSWLAACEKDDLGPTVEADEGMVQPDGNGVGIDEQAACLIITEAEDETRERLGCDAAERAPCPEYIRPAGARVCLLYDEGSVEACAEFIGDYSKCSDFQRRPCIVTTLGEAEGCDLGSFGGAAGAAGGGGAGGAAAAPAAGAGGLAAAGASGAPAAGSGPGGGGGILQTAGSAGLATSGAAGTAGAVQAGLGGQTAGAGMAGAAGSAGAAGAVSSAGAAGAAGSAGAAGLSGAAGQG